MLPSIRPAEPTDIPAITAIYAAAVRCGTASFEVDPPDEAEMRRRYDALRVSRHPYLVAELERTIVDSPMRGPIVPDRPIVLQSRTRSISRQAGSGGDSGSRCSNG